MRKTIIVLMIMALFINIVQGADLSYSLTLDYDNGVITTEDLELIEGSAPDRNIQPENGYTANVISFDDEILYSFKFAFATTISYALPREWFDENGTQIYFPNETEQTALDQTTEVLIIPYYETAKSIEIYDPDDIRILLVDVSEYSICNLNEICDGDESPETCPQDCTPGSIDNYCNAVNDGICDPDCLAGEDEDCAPVSPIISIDLLGIVIGIAIAIGLLSVYWHLNKKEKRIEKKLKKARR